MRRVTDARGRFARGQPINPAALRQARLNAELTLAEAADGIVTRQAFFQYESGITRPRRQTLNKIATRLQVPVDGLLARPHDPREHAMRDLEEAQQWDRLERLARAVLADANVTARIRAVALLYLGRAIHQVAPTEALTVLRQARGKLAQVGEPWLAAEACDWEAACLYHLQDPTALDVGRKALSRYRMLADRDPGVEARMLEHIGTYLLQRQEVAEAMKCYQAAIETAGTVVDLSRLANIYHGIASGCSRIGETRQALEYFERAVHLSRIHHDVKGAVTASLARLENDYGDCLVRLGRWERAEEILHDALDHFDAAGVDIAKSAALLTMGDLKHLQGQLDEAIRWTHQAIELAERLDERVLLAEGYQQLGELWAARGDGENYEACFARALEILDEAGLPERHAEAVVRYERARGAEAESLPGS
jgi:tetratricopeptide (TPR) repeat protein